MDYTKSILQEEFPYYKRLSEVEKSRFAARVKAFKKYKTIEGREGFVVDERAEILVSATSIQLTFGLNEYLLDYFDEIIIYPHKYYSHSNNNYHVGEVDTKGLVVLSWEDFYVGILIENDSKNVGLHEFAHSLMLSDAMHLEVDSFFSNYYPQWEAAAHKYLSTHKKGSGFFRDYALINIQEFFAVGVEYFFEKTSEFRMQEPVLFIHFCKLLNQIPDQPIKHVYKSEGNIDFSLEKGVLDKVRNTEGRVILILKFVMLVSIILGIIVPANKGLEMNEKTGLFIWVLSILSLIVFSVYQYGKWQSEVTLLYYADKMVLSNRLSIIKEIYFHSICRIEFIKNEESAIFTFYFVRFYYRNGDTYSSTKFSKEDIVDMGILNYLYNKLGIFVLHYGNVVLSKINL